MSNARCLLEATATGIPKDGTKNGENPNVFGQFRTAWNGCGIWMGESLRVAGRFRITTFGRPRAPWRATVEEVLDDAIRLELASWDASRREWFLAVPVEIETEKPACNGMSVPGAKGHAES